ncbi:hypothetical protein AB3X91_19010 [Paraburkholderia sp. BR14263]|uniref:hypothetical protein n=1 Tax=unclassified Paraburkholderia TaxID=2615204 RepID=UPI0034CEF826
MNIPLPVRTSSRFYERPYPVDLKRENAEAKNRTSVIRQPSILSATRCPEAQAQNSKSGFAAAESVATQTNAGGSIIDGASMVTEKPVNPNKH